MARTVLLGFPTRIVLSRHLLSRVIRFLNENPTLAAIMERHADMTRRFNYNTSAEGRQENRRVNIILGYPN